MSSSSESNDYESRIRLSRWHKEKDESDDVKTVGSYKKESGSLSVEKNSKNESKFTDVSAHSKPTNHQIYGSSSSASSSIHQHKNDSNNTRHFYQRLPIRRKYAQLPQQRFSKNHPSPSDRIPRNNVNIPFQGMQSMRGNSRKGVDRSMIQTWPNRGVYSSNVSLLKNRYVILDEPSADAPLCDNDDVIGCSESRAKNRRRNRQKHQNNSPL